MNAGFVILFMLFAMGLIMGVGGMIHDLYSKKHGLVKGANESQLAEIKALLESLHERVARIEENQAEQLLDTYEPGRDRITGD
jgi:hypothetical protein